MDRIIRYAVERKRAQVALLRSEERYRLLFETIPYPICVFSKHTAAFLAVNQAALDHYGYSKEEFLRRGILDLNIPESVAVTSAWLAANDWRSPLRTRHRRKNGSDMDVEMTVGEVDFAAEPAGFAIITDISERRRARGKTGIPGVARCLDRLGQSRVAAGARGADGCAAAGKPRDRSSPSS